MKDQGVLLTSPPTALWTVGTESQAHVAARVLVAWGLLLSPGSVVGQRVEEGKHKLGPASLLCLSLCPALLARWSFTF